MSDNFRLQDFNKIKRLMRCRKEINNRTRNETRVIKLCDYFKISIPSNLNRLEFERKYYVIDQYYRRYIDVSNSIHQRGYDSFRDFIYTAINNQPNTDLITHNNTINIDKISEMEIETDKDNQNLLGNENICLENYHLVDNSNIDMDDIVLEEIEPIDAKNSLYDMELDFLSNDDLNEIENVSIPDEILVNQYRDCIEDDHDLITDDEIDFNDIYEIDNDILFENLQDDLIDKNKDIYDTVVVDNGTIIETNKNSNDKTKFVRLNENNFSIDHIIENTYGRSGNLNTLTRNNELSNLLIEEENNESNIIGVNNLNISNDPQENASFNIKDKKNSDHINDLENDFKNFNILSYFNLKQNNELCAIDSVINESIELSESMRNYDIEVPNIPQISNKKDSFKKEYERYNIIRSETLIQSRYIGINLCKNAPIPFTLSNSGIEEDSYGYLNRLFGGYRYHLYTRSQNIQDYELIHLVFTVVSRIFRSASQYFHDITYYNQVLKSLLESIPKENRKNNVKELINNVLKSNVDRQLNFDNNVFLPDEEIIMDDIRDGYEIPLDQMTLEQQQLVKYTTLAKCCNEECDSINVSEYTIDIVAIFIAFQKKENNIKTIYKIIRYIEDKGTFTMLNKLGKCYSRIRGLVMRIKEIRYQLTWLINFARNKMDPDLKNFKGFNTTLKAIVIEKEPMRSNEISLDLHKEVIDKVRYDIMNIKLRMCILCERINVSNMRLLKKGKKVYNRIMNIVNMIDNSLDRNTIETATDVYSKIDNNHPFLNKEEIYLCTDCYNGSTDKNLRNNPLGITKYSVRNGLYCDKIPEVLKNLNQFEKLILQKRWIIQSIFAINNVNVNIKSHMNCISGYSISIKINSQKTFDDLLVFGKRHIIIINKSQYKIRSSNLVDLRKVYNAYEWLIKNNNLYKDDVLLCMEDFYINYVQTQFTFVDDVTTKRQQIIKNLDKSIRKKINRKAKKNLSDEEKKNGIDPYDEEPIFKFDQYVQKTDFEPFLLESSNDGDANFDPLAVFIKEHLKINWNDSELNMSKKMFESFPYIFPYARFGVDHPRMIPLTNKEYLKALLSKSQRHFSKESHLIMALSKMEQKKDAINCIRMVGNMQIGEKMTVEESLATSREGKLMRIFRKLKTSDSYWHDITNKLNIIETYIGSPTWFLTLNPSEHQWEELKNAYKLLHVDKNIPFNLKKSIEDDPYVLNIIFEKRLNIIMEHLKSNESVLGKVIFYYYKIEYQQRGTPHVHMLLWTDEGMILDYTDKNGVEKFIDKYITTSLYTSLEDTTFTEKILNEQKHKCRLHYCKRRKLIRGEKANSKNIECYTTTCRFGYPKNSSHKTKILKLNDDVESLLEVSKKTQKTYVIRRMENEKDINQYNPHVKLIWLGNIDLQPNALNFSNTGAINYASKYVSKSSLSNNEKVTEYLQTAMKSNNKTVCAKLFHLMYGMHLRPQAYTEVIDIARSANSHYTSLNVININTGGTENRTRHLYKDKKTDKVVAATNMYDNYYFSRPPLLENACLFSFFANFTPRQVTNTCKLKTKDDFDINMFLLTYEDLDNELKKKYFSGYSTDKYGNIYNYVTKDWNKRDLSSPCFEYHRDLSIPIGSTVEELRRPKTHLLPHKITLIDFFRFMGIVEDGHEYNNYETEQDIYSRYCRLFIPRRREIDTTQENCKLLFTRYMQYLELNNNQTYNDINKLIKICNTYLKKTLASKEFSLYKKELYEKYKEILDIDGGNFKRIMARNDGFTDPVAKFKDMNHLLNSISLLNTQQSLIYNTLYKKSIERYDMYQDNKSFSSKRIICDGPGGTGKSFMIDVLSASITIALRQKMITSECKNQPFVLKVSPTGVASVNISGRTIHSLFSLPVQKSKFKMKLDPLNATAKSKLYGILKNVQLLIIDEISMVDASMLYAVNHRINEALNCDSGTVFGNLNCLFTGDILQLPPVKKTARDSQMFYEEINESLYEAQFGDTIGLRSAFLNFNFIPLTENNRQREDPQYGLVLNEIREGKITEEFESIIKSRTFNKLSLGEIYLKSIRDGHSDPIILTPKNEDVDKINVDIVTEFSKRKKEELYLIHCNDTVMVEKNCYKRVWLRKENKITNEPLLNVNLDILEDLLIAYEKKSKKNETGLHEKLLLCKGATVMIKRNLDLEKSICNGARGFIEDIVFRPNLNMDKKLKANDVSEIKVRLYETGKIVSIPASWHYFVCGKSLMRRLQIPITLAYCTTVHKSQGLTLSSSIIHFPKNENNKISKTPGILYVALSRIKHSNGLYIKDLDIDAYNIPNEQNILTLSNWKSFYPTEEINYTPYDELHNQ
uniref:ATP-dependent DNA helicase n=1 Tax=Strongyloides venezuelensis TaxID=75913 RepID=A0A0K0FEZ1_STRVS